MKKILGFLLCVVVTLFLSTSAQALDFDFSGTFTADNDFVLLDFTVGSDSTITIFSSSWGDDTGPDGYVPEGGFDPILAIWDSAGNYVTSQDDGENVGSTESNGVFYTHGVWDSFFAVFLTAGDYTASITQYDNFPVNCPEGTLPADCVGVSNLADGFIHDGNPDFTFDEGFGSAPQFNGVWFEEVPNGNGFEDPRTGDWAFHILDVESATGPGPAPVPEPTTMLLIGTGLVGLVGFRRKFRA